MIRQHINKIDGGNERDDKLDSHLSCPIISNVLCIYCAFGRKYFMLLQNQSEIQKEEGVRYASTVDWKDEGE